MYICTLRSCPLKFKFKHVPICIIATRQYRIESMLFLKQVNKRMKCVNENEWRHTVPPYSDFNH